MSDCYIGLATPQANPTVETEFQQFMRGPARPVFTRLTSAAEKSSDRLVEYIEQLPAALASFDTLPLTAFGFACTASSYLVGHEREEFIAESAEQQHRVQVVTATQAIRRELEGHGARKIAVLSPYPESICQLAADYWQSIGFEVVAMQHMDTGSDTRATYSVTDDQVLAALQSFDTADAAVTLISGTGMRSITACLQSPSGNTPVLSSNICLATELLRRAQLWPPRDAANVRRLLGE